ncbi:MAG: DUF4340 domain-containing protein [Chlorobi bacterium]|nr:DUF4340 domain-containing protein [Chlorobiota bacterium]
MYRKFSIKTLAITFGVLLLAVIAVKVSDSFSRGNTLKNVLFDINTDDVTTIRIYPQTEKGKEITLVKNNGLWSVKYNGATYNGDQNLINSLPGQINKLKPLRLAATKKESWKNFQVTDSAATKVVLENNGKVLAGLYIGKFSYIMPKNRMPQQNPYMRQPQGKMNTYVRTLDDNNVYAVEGFLGMSFNRSADDFRDKTIISANKNDLTKLTFSYPADSSFVLSKKDNKWFVDDQPADSASVAGYLNKITHLRGRTFADAGVSSFNHSVKIEGNNMEPVTVQAFVSENGAVITSSRNKGTIFTDDKKDIVKKLFVSKKELLSKNN